MSMRRLSGIVAGGLLLLASIAEAQQPAACNQARAEYVDGKFAAAASLLVQCRNTGGDDTAVLLVAAQSLYKAAHYSEAEQFALSLLAKDPKSQDAMYLLGHLYQSEDQPRESLAWFTRAASVMPPKAADLRSVGLDYVLLEDYPDAIHWLRRSVELDARDPEAWYDLGRAQMMQSEPVAAEQSLTQSLKLDPRSVKAENNLGLTFEAENRAPDAIAAYRLALSWQDGLATQSEQPFLNLGTLLVTQQRATEAIPLLQHAAVIAPRNVPVHEQLARALEQSGDKEGALAQMQQAVRLDDQNARLHFELGQMFRRAGKTEMARKELTLSGKLYGEHSTTPSH